MKHHPINGTDLHVSSFCYGVMHFGTVAKNDDIYKLYECYCQAGGNFFDTAHSYACWITGGDGASETSLGKCIRKFGNRDQIVVSTKGGLHGAGTFYVRPDDCMTAEVIASDISDSLNRLQIDHIDLYILHRDNPRHPVSEIIDMLNREISRGRIRYIGASNWTTARLIEANAYAERKGLKPFVVSSPQWNMLKANHHPINWDGSYDTTAHMMDDADIHWHNQSKLAVMPWTPTGYGYVSGATSRNAQSFDNVISQKRRERAYALAKELNCTPMQIALGYLRAHDFPVFPILGTMNRDHLAESLHEIVLTPKQRDWLINVM